MQGSGKVMQWDGLPITRPGVYKGIPLDLYHSSELFDGKPSISSSGMRKLMRESPEHYWCESPYNPQRIEPKDKKHFVIGRALHHLVSGERFFGKLFAITPENIFDPKEKRPVRWNGNRIVCRDWIQREKDRGRSILTLEDAKNLEGMALALGRHPAVMQGILRGHVEHSFFWVDKDTGVWCKWRPDATPIGSLDYVDLKTTTDVRYPALVRTLGELAYYWQGGLGRMATRELLGAELKSFTLLFIEKDPPWSIALEEVKEYLLIRGELACKVAIMRFAECWKANHWPGPTDAGYLDISARSLEELDTMLKENGLEPPPTGVNG